MNKFQQATFPDDEKTKLLEKICPHESVWMNDTYQVIIYDCKKTGMIADGFPDMWWLSIKRIDKQPIRDWVDFQRIKNMLVGAEHEAVELFPAESRLVNTSNQHHLFIFKEKGLHFPFGFNQGRAIANQKDVEAIGAVQRKLR